MVSSRVRSGAAVAVIGVALFATLGESTKESGSGSNRAPNAQMSTDSSEESAAPESSAAAPIPLGTPTQVASGWELTVNSANLNADDIIASSSSYVEPEAGTHFVLVNVTMANTSNAPGSAWLEVDVSMLPPSGIAIDESFMCSSYLPDAFDTMAQMQPGSVQTGNLCFEVKEGEIATSLLLGEPGFTMDKAKDQRFFAIQ